LIDSFLSGLPYLILNLSATAQKHPEVTPFPTIDESGELKSRLDFQDRQQTHKSSIECFSSTATYTSPASYIIPTGFHTITSSPGAIAIGTPGSAVNTKVLTSTPA